jgi:hypothetical protein
LFNSEMRSICPLNTKSNIRAPRLPRFSKVLRHLAPMPWDSAYDPWQWRCSLVMTRCFEAHGIIQRQYIPVDCKVQEHRSGIIS